MCQGVLDYGRTPRGPHFLPRRVHNSFPTDSFPLTFVPNESGVRMRTQPRHLAAGERKLPVPTIRCLSFMLWVVFSLSLCPPSLIGSKLHLFKISILAFVYTRETIPRAEMVNLFVTPPTRSFPGLLRSHPFYPLPSLVTPLPATADALPSAAGEAVLSRMPCKRNPRQYACIARLLPLRAAVSAGPSAARVRAPRSLPGGGRSAPWPCRPFLRSPVSGVGVRVLSHSGPSLIEFP